MITTLASWSIVMDALRAFLEEVKTRKLGEGHFLGLLHILIGRKINKEDGPAVSSGMTWRELAAVLKKVRWGKDAVGELDIDMQNLTPRERERFWYLVISRAGVDSEAAIADGNALARILQKHGYDVGPAPGRGK